MFHAARSKIFINILMDGLVEAENCIDMIVLQIRFYLQRSLYCGIFCIDYQILIERGWQ